MRAPRVRFTHPHTLPTRSCAADEARRAVLHAIAACRPQLAAWPPGPPYARRARVLTQVAV
ncbi:hypothetical protein T492DRAFT_934502 [Pavlovales sp. CCMP2436]|nr:hypothetical protein T492DRAFT_934502 [Pavlovales sp. CCMP2436]